MKNKLMAISLSVFAAFSIASGCKQENGNSPIDENPPVYYAVTFIMPDGTAKEIIVKEGESLNSDQLPVIEVEGYEGVKWNRQIFSKISQNITVEVDYSNRTPIEYTVKYDVNGGTVLQDDKVTYDAQYTLRTPVAPEGYYFYSWCNVDDECLKNEDSADDYKANVALSGTWKIAGKDKTVNLKAVYKKEDDIVVTFLQTGQEPQQLKVEKGQKITEEQLASIKIVQDAGYENFEWNFDFANTVINEPIQINLKPFVPKTFTITYDLGEVENPELIDKDGKKVEGSSLQVKFGDVVEIRKAKDKNTDLSARKVFVGWVVKDSDPSIQFSGGRPYEFTDNITLVAQWRELTEEEKKEIEEEKNWTDYY